MAGEMVKQPQHPLVAMISGDAFKKAVAQVIPKHVSPERMIFVIRAAMSRTPKLLECTGESLACSIMAAAQLGIEPTGMLGQGYLIPYYNGKMKKMEAQFQIGYRGLIDLARRSGRIKNVYAINVFAEDTFNVALGTSPKIDHWPNYDGERSWNTFKGAYAVAEFKDGTTLFEYMTKGEIEAIRRRSKSSDGGPWVTDTLEMARKCPVKRLCKYLPQSPELETALQVDVDDVHQQPVRLDARPLLDAMGIEAETIQPDAPKQTRTEQLTEKLGVGAKEPELPLTSEPDDAQNNAPEPPDDGAPAWEKK